MIIRIDIERADGSSTYQRFAKVEGAVQWLEDLKEELEKIEFIEELKSAQGE